MFTGIVTDVGSVVELVADGVVEVTIEAPDTARRVDLGASVSCAGACLTVIRRTARTFTVEVSAETRGLTTAHRWQVGSKLNLECSARLGDEIGGHIVLGHVDATVEVDRVEVEPGRHTLAVAVPPALAPLVAPKGSIALDGVSLTVNTVDPRLDGFAIAAINIIPYTVEQTTLGDLHPGDAVNLEVDVLARYVQRLVETRSSPSA